MKTYFSCPRWIYTSLFAVVATFAAFHVNLRVSIAQEDEIAGAGRFQYQTHCASCHGVTGKGNGPMVDVLLSKPADLTQLSKKNGGKFPFWRVYQVIDGRAAIHAHGERSMPVWGTWFLKTERNEVVVIGRILELGHYLKSIQEP